MDSPFITIVMPVYNEDRFIEQTIRQLLEQEYPADRYEILVADGMSTDNTRGLVQALASQHPQIRLLDNPKRRSSAGRNVGFQHGRGEYFLVVDGHCYIPNNQLLRHVAECFAISGADCLGRPQPLTPPALTCFQQAVALARGSWLGHGRDSLIYSDYEGFCSPVSNGSAYARHVFARVGYVDEAFDACEDVEFNYRVERAGLTCYTSPGLTIQYYPRENMRSLWRQMVRYGEGRFRFVCNHREALTIAQLVPAGCTVGLLVLIALVITNKLDLMIAKFIGLLYGIYLFSISVESLRVSLRAEQRCFLYLPWVFAAIHFGLGWGFVKESARSTAKFRRKNTP